MGKSPLHIVLLANSSFVNPALSLKHSRNALYVLGTLARKSPSYTKAIELNSKNSDIFILDYKL